MGALRRPDRNGPKADVFLHGRSSVGGRLPASRLMSAEPIGVRAFRAPPADYGIVATGPASWLSRQGRRCSRLVAACKTVGRSRRSSGSESKPLANMQARPRGL